MRRRQKMKLDIVVVHVQGYAVDPNYTYTGVPQMAGYKKLAEICQQVGLAQTEMFSVGYDDISFEVPTQDDAVQACDALNKALPRSKSKMGYGYCSSLAATAQDLRTDRRRRRI